MQLIEKLDHWYEERKVELVLALPITSVPSPIGRHKQQHFLSNVATFIRKTEEKIHVTDHIITEHSCQSV
jgi:lysyl-tRNA synthetase class I